ncbi:MAG: cytochrome c4 [Gammaproteobacteria bacterium]|nr:cytochrome c4 [Gammaproteobacteria bacterium]
MRMYAICWSLLCLPCGVLSAAVTPVRPDVAVLCSGCHGPDGNSEVGHYPRLAGQGKNYLIKQLKDFRSGARKEQHMSSMVEAISPADIPLLADWFAGQSPKSHHKTTATTGQQIFQNGIEQKGVAACAGCHGEAGQGNDAIGFPRLAGQQREYLAKQLRDFRNGTRRNDNMIMQGIAKQLSDAEITALATYLAAGI